MEGKTGGKGASSAAAVAAESANRMTTTLLKDHLELRWSASILLDGRARAFSLGEHQRGRRLSVPLPPLFPRMSVFRAGKGPWAPKSGLDADQEVPGALEGDPLTGLAVSRPLVAPNVDFLIILHHERESIKNRSKKIGLNSSMLS